MFCTKKAWHNGSFTERLANKLQATKGMQYGGSEGERIMWLMGLYLSYRSSKNLQYAVFLSLPLTSAMNDHFLFSIFIMRKTLVIGHYNGQGRSFLNLSRILLSSCHESWEDTSFCVIVVHDAAQFLPKGNAEDEHRLLKTFVARKISEEGKKKKKLSLFHVSSTRVAMKGSIQENQY